MGRKNDITCSDIRNFFRGVVAEGYEPQDEGSLDRVTRDRGLVQRAFEDGMIDEIPPLLGYPLSDAAVAFLSDPAKVDPDVNDPDVRTLLGFNEEQMEMPFMGVKENKVQDTKKVISEIVKILPAGLKDRSTHGSHIAANAIETEVVDYIVREGLSIEESNVVALTSGVIAEVSGSFAGAINWVKDAIRKRGGKDLTSKERSNLAWSVRQEYPIIKTDKEALQVVDQATSQIKSGKSGALAGVIAKTLPQDKGELMSLARDPAKIMSYTREVWNSSGIDTVEPSEIRRAIVDYIISKTGIRKESRLYARMGILL